MHPADLEVQAPIKNNKNGHKAEYNTKYLA